MCINTNTNSVVMKQYRLLRDNKETGPYAAEELIQSGLKKYDLIWVDGRSAAWRYPCEIDVFKPYVPPVDEQPFDRFYKRASQSNSELPVTAAAPPVITATVKTEKPRYRIKADCNKIETVVTTVPSMQVKPIEQPQRVSYDSWSEPVNSSQAAHPSTSPAWETMWLDWEQEKKAVAATTATVNSVAARIKALGQEDEVLETKFSQSLDDIAGKYAESLLARKKSGGFEKYKSQLTAAVLLIAILAAGMWVGLKWSDKTGYVEANNQQQHIQLIPDAAATNESDADNTDATTDNMKEQQQENIIEPNQPIDEQKESIAATPAINRSSGPAVNTKRKTGLTVKKTGSTVQNKNVVTKRPDQHVPAVQKNYQPSVTDVNGARSSVKRNEAGNTAVTGTATQPVSANENKREVKKAESIDDYVDVESFPVSTGVQYNVSNISDVPLDLVMIDLQYFDANGKYLKGETLTLKDIGAGGSIKVNAPQNAKAAGIKYKVSMISSTQNDLNIIAD